MTIKLCSTPDNEGVQAGSFGSHRARSKCEVVIFRSHGYEGRNLESSGGGRATEAAEKFIREHGARGCNWSRVGIMGCYATQSMNMIAQEYAIENFTTANVTISVSTIVPPENLTNGTGSAMTYSEIARAGIDAGRASALQIANKKWCKCECEDKKVVFKVKDVQAMPSLNNANLWQNVLNRNNYPNATFGDPKASGAQTLMQEEFPCQN